MDKFLMKQLRETKCQKNRSAGHRKSKTVLVDKTRNEKIPEYWSCEHSLFPLVLDSYVPSDWRPWLALLGAELNSRS
jgi:hypothetical protein